MWNNFMSKLYLDKNIYTKLIYIYMNEIKKEEDDAITIS